MRIFLTILLFSAIPTEAAVETQEAMNQDKLIIGINANRLLAGSIVGYGMLPARSSIESGKPVVIKKEDPEEEYISIESKRNLWRRGRRYELMRGIAQVGIMQIGVFADSNEALGIYRDHQLHTSVLPIETLSKDLGNRSVRWWTDHLKGFSRILFIRDNVVVDIYLFLEKFTEMGGNAGATLEIAKAIDKALVEGTLGVQRGKFLKVPRILAIETPKKLVSRSKVEVKVRIAIPENPKDPNSKEIEIVRTLPFYVPFVSAEETLEENKTFTYEITYITPGCVVTSKQVTLTVAPAAP